MLVFQAHNVHVDAPAKTIEAGKKGDAKYYSYYENAHGEQWIFVYDHNDRMAWLYGGDIGWKPKSMPPESVAQHSPEMPVPVVGDIILNAPEALWLTACWAAVRERFAAG